MSEIVADVADRSAAAIAPGPPALIGSLVPEAAAVEAYADVPETDMHPAEAAIVQGAVAERRREFGTARYCARLALQVIGAPVGPVLSDADGAPLWPAGVVGSLTHCQGYRAAVVAWTAQVAGIGIDAEPHAALPDGVRDLVLREEERDRLRTLAAGCPDVCWDRLVFCAKEAVFKAWFPWTGRWLGFEDVSVAVRFDGTFRAGLRPAHADAPGPIEMFGRWTVVQGLVLVAARIPRRLSPADSGRESS